MIISNDKRLQPPVVGNIWCDRISEREWHHCDGCYRDVPTFQFAEGTVGSTRPMSVLRCCWECGYGIEHIDPVESLRNQEDILLHLEDQFDGGDA